MTVSATYGMIVPGEKEATINFSTTIDNASANASNTGREVLEDIFILRLENGRDYYITVTAKYAQSCFGMSVNKLVMYTQPICNVSLDPVQRAETQESNQTAALYVLKELWRIVNAIYKKGLHEKDFSSTPGFAEVVYKIQEYLNTGDPFGDY